MKKILTEPYNEQKIISTNNSNNNLIISLNAGHGFNKNQILKLSNATPEIFNKEYRVIESNSLSVILRSPSEEEVLPLNEDVAITLSGAPLGYSVCYENLDEGILCIKNTNKESPAILRVIDKIPPNEYGTNWSKYGRVTIGQNITEEGTFVDNIKAPFHPGCTAPASQISPDTVRDLCSHPTR